ncbi:mtDNA inheritance, partitioning of the mitochondrial organelle, partial [Massospora cicadina]
MGQEIITLQFGQYANAIGSQYWAQLRETFRRAEANPEAYDSSELRAYDIALAEDGFADGQFDTDLWGKQPQLILPERRGEAQTSWSDLDTTVYNMRTPQMVTAYHPNCQTGPKFQSYFDGCERFELFEKENETIDSSLRFFTEESDSIQGFQVLADMFDGFSGFSTLYLEAIRDEYPKSPILLFSATSHPTKATSDFSAMNRALCWVETAKIGCTSIAVDPNLALASVSNLGALEGKDKFWTSSFAISVAIDAALSATRAVKSHSSIETIRQTLNSRGSTFHSELFCESGALGDEMAFIESVAYSTPLSLSSWLGSNNLSDAESSFRSVASLKTTSLPFNLFSDVSQLRRFFSRSPVLASYPDLHSLERSLLCDLTDISENYA